MSRSNLKLGGICTDISANEFIKTADLSSRLRFISELCLIIVIAYVSTELATSQPEQATLTMPIAMVVIWKRRVAHRTDLPMLPLPSEFVGPAGHDQLVSFPDVLPGHVPSWVNPSEFENLTAQNPSEHLVQFDRERTHDVIV
jgi:hypothetical protein